MTENRSLDDFFAAADAEDGDATGDSDSADSGVGESDPAASAAADESASAASTAGDEPPEESPSEPLPDESAPADSTSDKPTATYRWSPSGRDCPACGETVERQWRDGDEFVCADCKAW